VSAASGNDLWQTLYKTKIQQILTERNQDVYGDMPFRFFLVDIDSDAIPELVIEKHHDLDFVRNIFTVSNGNIVDLKIINQRTGKDKIINMDSFDRYKVYNDKNTKAIATIIETTGEFITSGEILEYVTGQLIKKGSIVELSEKFMKREGINTPSTQYSYFDDQNRAYISITETEYNKRISEFYSVLERDYSATGKYILDEPLDSEYFSSEDKSDYIAVWKKSGFEPINVNDVNKFIDGFAITDVNADISTQFKLYLPKTDFIIGEEIKPTASKELVSMSDNAKYMVTFYIQNEKGENLGNEPATGYLSGGSSVTCSAFTTAALSEGTYNIVAEAVEVSEGNSLSGTPTGKKETAAIKINLKKPVNEISVYVNDSKITFDQPPVTENSRVLVPIRAIAEAMGAAVDWDGTSQTNTIVKDSKTVKMQIGNNTMTVDGAPIQLDVPPKIVGDRILVPVRAIAEAFGAKVEWSGLDNTVYISSTSTNIPTLASPVKLNAPTNAFGNSAIQFSWLPVDNAQFYAVNWSLDGKEGSFSTYDTSVSIGLPNISGVMYIDVYACGSYDNRWTQSSELKLEVKISPVPQQGVPLNPTNRVLSELDYSRILDILSAGIEIYSHVEDLPDDVWVKLTSSVGKQIYIDGTDKALKALNLTRGTGYYTVDELMKNQVFSKTIGLKYASHAIDYIGYGLTAINIGDYWANTGDWGFSLAWAGWEGAKEYVGWAIGGPGGVAAKLFLDIVFEPIVVE
jgi:hypothetical protein